MPNNNNDKKYASGGNIAIATLRKIVEQTINQNPIVFKRLAEI